VPGETGSAKLAPPIWLGERGSVRGRLVFFQALYFPNTMGSAVDASLLDAAVMRPPPKGYSASTAARSCRRRW